jgi:hypothetical protein
MIEISARSCVYCFIQRENTLPEEYVSGQRRQGEGRMSGTPRTIPRLVAGALIAGAVIASTILLRPGVSNAL